MTDLIDTLITAALDSAAGADINIPDLTRHILDQARRDPTTFAQWLDELAYRTVAVHVRSTLASRRSSAFHGRFASAFRAAAANGTVDQLKDTLPKLMDTYFDLTDPDGHRVQRRLGAMTGPDCRLAADSYAHRARSLEVRAAVLRKIAAKVRNRTVADVYSEDQLRNLFGSAFNEQTTRAA